MSELSAAAPAAESTGASDKTPNPKKSGQNRTLWGDVRYELARKPLFWVSSLLVLIVLTMSFVPQLWAGTSPNESGACQLANARVAPSWDKPFGYTAAGCDITSAMWDSPRGMTRTPNIATIHGMVRQRDLAPMKPIRNSKV